MSVADYYAEAKDNWRILLLTVFLLVSAAAIAPGANSETPTALQFGLELSGGTQVRAPLEGKTATGLDFSGVDDVTAFEESVAGELGVPATAVQARPGSGAFEVYDENVSDGAIASALQANGQDVAAADVEGRVTEQTYDTAKRVIETKLAESPDFSGGTVSIQRTPTGDLFLKVEVPGATRDEVLELLNERGLVRVVATFPDQRGNETVVRNVTLFTQDDLQSDVVREDSEGNPYVPVTLTEEAAQNFSQAMRTFGYAEQDGTVCNFEADPENPGYCLVTWKDGEFVSAHGLHPDLSRSFRNDEFGRAFRMNTESIEEARDIRVALQAGALPTDIAIQEGDNLFIESEFAQQFKLFSLITGIVAALAVAAVVFVRYREPRVAAPMVATALAEVFILLGFAASVGLALDLSHIAGFIAVIGTGVDDLVIIADEVLNRGDVKTRRVFQNRFRKAFWVIGVAAITTIIAMAPLTVLSLGDLTGFALVTIVGVLIGVLVTRPAYGDILRALMTRVE